MDGPDDREPRARFEYLYDRYQAELLRYAARRVGVAQAEDVVAEAFTVAWRRVQEIPEDAPRPWLYATVRRVVANHLRSENRKGRLTDRLSRYVAVPLVIEDHADDLISRLHLAAAFSSLPIRDQEILQLTEWERLPNAEAALVIGCSAKTFAVRLHRARRRLAARLAGDPDDAMPTLSRSTTHAVSREQ